MIPEAVPSEGAVFVRVADLTDDYVVAAIDTDGSTIWRRIDADTRAAVGAAVCEARYEPDRYVTLRLPLDVAERLAHTYVHRGPDYLDDDDWTALGKAALNAGAEQ